MPKRSETKGAAEPWVLDRETTEEPESPPRSYSMVDAACHDMCSCANPPVMVMPFPQPASPQCTSDDSGQEGSVSSDGTLFLEDEEDEALLTPPTPPTPRELEAVQEVQEVQEPHPPHSLMVRPGGMFVPQTPAVLAGSTDFDSFNRQVQRRESSSGDGISLPPHPFQWPPAPTAPCPSPEADIPSPRDKFTIEEDVKIMRLRFLENLNWGVISEKFLPLRSEGALQVHTSTCLRDQLEGFQREWTQEEDDELCCIVKEHHRALWDTVSKRLTNQRAGPAACYWRHRLLVSKDEDLLEKTLSEMGSS